MSFFSRDFQATVVHVDSEVIRATLGLQDLLAKPSVVSLVVQNGIVIAADC